jgi:hypothetical protein
MRSRIKTLGLLMLIGVFVVTIAACSGESSGDSPSGGDAPSTQPSGGS